MNISDDRKKYEALRDVAKALGGMHASKELLQTIVTHARELLGAERGFALLKGGSTLTDTTDIEAVHVETVGGFQVEATHRMLTISGSVLRHVLDTGESVLTVDAQSDERFGEAESLIIHGIRSVACAPMRVRNTVIGALYLDWRGAAASLEKESIEFLEALATQAAMVLDSSRLVSQLEAENRELRAVIGEPYDLIGESPAIRKVFRLMEKILPTDAPVLILGESGTGKELVARSLHSCGPRSNQSFVAQFCGALPETLLESELFGHKKGSFTGAHSDKRGLFELASGGTFFLDEIADLTLATQTKLLRVLEEGEFRPVGDTRTVTVDVRIIAATNKDMEQELRSGRFREDLYYRLNVFTITMPPLRERRTDVPLLADRFVDRFSMEMGIPPKSLSPKARKMLEHHHWPGNVRELRNVIQRAVLVSEDERIEPQDIVLDVLHGEVSGGQPAPQGERTLDDITRTTVMDRLESYGGNKTQTAKSLGVSLRWLHYRLKEWDG